jgi:hypothetical protein
MQYLKLCAASLLLGVGALMAGSPAAAQTAVPVTFNVPGGLGDRLRLVVNWGTGEMSILNPSDQAVSIGGYTIVSQTGSLNPASDGRNSFQDQGLDGWDQADNSNSARLTEFNPSGALALTPGHAATIGRPLFRQPSSETTLAESTSRSSTQ